MVDVDKFVKQLVEEYGLAQTQQILAHNAGFERIPPTISQFLDDPDYLGGVIKVYPKWRDALRQVYPSPFGSPYLEVALTGAIGLGKTSVSRAGMMYDMTFIQCLKKPTEYFDLAPSTKLAFAMINANMQLSKAVLADELDEWCQLSPFFKKLRKEAGKKSFLPKNVHVVYGSRFTHVLGMATIGALLSELNFQQTVAGQAYENYTNTVRRLKSRFGAAKQQRGSYPGRIWLDSSKNDMNSFMEKHIEDNRSDPELIVFDFPYWEVHKHRMRYSGKTFKVFFGDKTRDPFIVSSPSQLVNVPESLVLDVPVEHKKEFEQNLPRALKDIAGKGTWSSLKLFKSVEKIKEALYLNNPVLMDEIVLDFFDKDQKLIDFLKIHELQDKSAPRYIHIDLALTGDCAAIASSYITGNKTLERLNPRTGAVETTRLPQFKTEFVIYIRAKDGQEIPIYKIKEFLLTLRATGRKINKVSTDGFQSANIRQDLSLEGFECELLSVDRTKDPYRHLSNIILESRLSGPNHAILIRELRELEDTGKKFDHPMNGSKDGADAVCGSVYAALQGLQSTSSVDFQKELLKELRSQTASNATIEQLFGSHFRG